MLMHGRSSSWAKIPIARQSMHVAAAFMFVATRGCCTRQLKRELWSRTAGRVRSDSDAVDHSSWQAPLPASPHQGAATLTSASAPAGGYLPPAAAAELLLGRRLGWQCAHNGCIGANAGQCTAAPAYAALLLPVCAGVGRFLWQHCISEVSTQP